MVDVRWTEQRTGAIAGIEIVHRLAPGIVLSEPATNWPAVPGEEHPIVIEHSVGPVSVDGMRHVMDIGMRVSYYAPPTGGVAIRVLNLEHGGPTHLVHVREPGRRYAVTYEHADPKPAYRRDVEITAYAHALTVRTKFLMAHGSGSVLGDGRGVICLGASGAGKSTLSRMIDGKDGARVLNDDRLVLEQRADGVRLWSTPWPGTAGVARAGDAPLRVIALIGRDSRTSVRAIGRRDALRRVLPTLALPIWDAELMEASLSFVDDLLGRVPVIELRYPLEERTADWVLNTLTEELR